MDNVNELVAKRPAPEGYEWKRIPALPGEFIDVLVKPQEVIIINGRKCIEVDAVKIFEMASLHERITPPKVKK